MTIEERNKKKSEIQLKAKQIWESVRRGTIAMCTGSGKTKLGIDISLNYNRILIVVPTEKLRDVRWEDEYKKWGHLAFYKKHIRRECYASLHKINLTQCDLIILDESHHITEYNFQNFGEFKGDILSLTATPPRDDVKKKIFKEYFPVKFTYPLDEGVRDGVVAPYEINAVGFELDKNKNFLVQTKQKKYMTSEYDRYKVLTRSVQEAMFNNRDPKFPILNRTRFLYTLPSKLKYARVILNKYIKDDRHLIFAGGIPHAEALSKHFYHSKTNDKDYWRFVKGEINQLATVNKLNEGEDIELLDSALITKITSNELVLIQQIGRIVRIRDDHKATIWILYSLNTQEEKWLAKATSKLDNTKINKFKIDSLEGVKKEFLI